MVLHVSDDNLLWSINKEKGIIFAPCVNDTHTDKDIGHFVGSDLTLTFRIPEMCPNTLAKLTDDLHKYNIQITRGTALPTKFTPIPKAPNTQISLPGDLLDFQIEVC